MSPRTQVRVEGFAAGGEGFGHLPDGRAAFLPGGFPGDVVELEGQETHRSWVRARRIRVIEPSPDREAPRCPVAGSCGGCDWIGLSREAQRRGKEEIVHEALRRTGHLTPEEIERAGATVGTVTPDWGARNRVRIHVDRRGQVGFHAPNSHEIVPISACPAAAPTVSQAIGAIAMVLKGRGELGIAAVEIRAAPQGPPLLFHLQLRRGAIVPRSIRQELASLATLAEQPNDSEPQGWPLPGGATLLARVGTFVQVTDDGNHALVTELLDGATRRGARSALDLYCGAGNFSLPLARAGLSVLGVEGNAGAVDDARMAAEALELHPPDLEFIARPVAEGLASLRPDRRFDLVLLDPPREGAAAVLRAALVRSHRWVALIGCDPVAWARDVRTILDAGWRLEGAEGYDLFPQTHHVEMVGWFVRAD